MPERYVRSRRGFLAEAGGLALATTLGGPAALAADRPARKPTLRGGTFAEGVMSGDPSPNAVTFWTRLSDVEGSGTVELEVARTAPFGTSWPAIKSARRLPQGGR